MKPVRALTALLLAATMTTAMVSPAIAGSSAVIGGGPRDQVLDSSTFVSGIASSTVATFTASGGPRSGPLRSSPIVTGRVLVRTKASANGANLASIARSVGTTAGGVSGVQHDRFVWRTPKGKTDIEFARELMATGKVVYAAPDRMRQLADYTPPSYVSPNDLMFNNAIRFTSQAYSLVQRKYVDETYPYGSSWWLRDIRAPQAWMEGYTGPSIVGKYPLRASGSDFTVAVIDSGVYLDHEDVQANIVGGKDCFDHQDPVNKELVTDYDVTPVPINRFPRGTSDAEARMTAAHGTCVSGEIAATANNSVGSVGVGYDTQVVVYKVMGVFADGTVGIDDDAVIDAILTATDKGAKVINMSLGGYGTDANGFGQDPLQDAIDYARGNGVVVVAAKGNDAVRTRYYPADYPGVISVGALDKSSSGKTVPAGYTNYAATGLDLMAPGSFVFGLCQPGYTDSVSSQYGLPTGYAIWDGTSMASPVVAGAVAWLWRAAPALSASEITHLVMSTASKHGAATHFPNGYRELDMYAAYKALEAQYPLLASPQLADQTLATLGTTKVAWATPTSPTRGVAYDVSVNGVPTLTGTPASAGQFAWTPATYSLQAAAHSVYNWDDGTAVDSVNITVTDPASGTASWSTAHVAGGSAVSATPAYRTPVTVEATLRDAGGTALTGATPVLQSNTGLGWVTSSAAVTELGSGVYRATVTGPDTRVSYRFSFAGAGNVGAAISSTVVSLPQYSVPAPSAKASVSHTKPFTVSGTFKPARASASRGAQLQVRRWNGSAWALYSRLWVKTTSHVTYDTYKTSLKLKRGGYRIYTYVPGDAKHATTTSAFRAVLVK